MKKINLKEKEFIDELKLLFLKHNVELEQHGSFWYGIESVNKKEKSISIDIEHLYLHLRAK